MIHKSRSYLIPLQSSNGVAPKRREKVARKQRAIANAVSTLRAEGINVR